MADQQNNKKNSVIRNVFAFGFAAVVVMCIVAPKAASVWTGIWIISFILTWIMSLILEFDAATPVQNQQPAGLTNSHVPTVTSASDRKILASESGKRSVHDTLQELPAEYEVLENVLVPVPNSGSQVELNFVVVGPNGAFMIKSRSFSGHVEGGEKAEYWTLTKNVLDDCGRQKFPPQQIPNNDFKSLNRAGMLLGEALEARKARVWLSGIVVMALDNDCSDIATRIIPVLPLSEINQYIRNFVPKYKIRDPKATAAAIRSISESLVRGPVT